MTHGTHATYDTALGRLARPLMLLLALLTAACAGLPPRPELPPEHALAKLGVPGLEQARREAEQAARNAARNAETMDEKREQVLDAVGREPLAALDAAEEKAREAAARDKAPETPQIRWEGTLVMTLPAAR